MKPTGFYYHFNHRQIYQLACQCKDCSKKFLCTDGKMIMLKNNIWKKISDKQNDEICSDCIEIRLGRKIKKKDLNPGKIPCNYYFLTMP